MIDEPIRWSHAYGKPVVPSSWQMTFWCAAGDRVQPTSSLPTNGSIESSGGGGRTSEIGAVHSRPGGADDRRYCTGCRPCHGAAVLYHIAFRAAYPSAVTHRPEIDRRRDVAGGPEQVCREPGRHEVRRPAMVFECACGQADDGGPIEMVVAPMALRERRRHERTALDQRKMRRLGRHPIIVAQRPTG
jgi:hypothetical protein